MSLPNDGRANGRTAPRSATRFATGGAAVALAFWFGLPLLAQDKDKPAAPPAGGGAAAPATPQGAATGAHAKADEALQKGLAWLVKQQHENGSFGSVQGSPDKAQGEAGMSALALRAIARAPQSVRAQVPGLDQAAEKCAQYLVSLQKEDGGIVNPGMGLTTYRTSISIMALQSLDPKRYADTIAKGRAYLVSGQWSEAHGLDADAAKAQKSPHYGGWGYDKTGTKPDADMSNTHFVLEALKETGLSESDAAWKRAAIFLQRCQNRSESNDLRPEGITIGNDGGFMYDPAEDTGKSTPVVNPDGSKTIPSYASITYAGLMSLLHAHVKKDDPRVKGAWSWITSNYTLDENRGLGSRANPGAGKQGLYYYYHTFAKALSAWGEAEITDAGGAKHRWADELVARLHEVQKPEGFWKNDEKRWWEDDPTLCTAYSLLAVEIAYPWITGAPK